VPTPAKITGVTATSKSVSLIALAWNVDVDATGYDVFRASILDGVQGAFRKISETTSNSFSDNSVKSLGYYAYKIRGKNTVFGPFSDVLALKAGESITRVAGFREDDIAKIHLNVNEFGVVAIWKKSGGDVVLRVIFESESQTVDPGTGQTITTAPEMWCSTKEINGMGRNERIDFDGLVYRVKNVQHDGTGLSVVELTKDMAR
jgi:hypothetical protein